MDANFLNKFAFSSAKKKKTEIEMWSFYNSWN